MSQVVDEARSLIRERLEEIETERSSLERALRGLEPKALNPHANGQPRKSTTSRRRRRQGPGQRREQFLALVQEEPGLSAAEIAKRLRISRSHAYSLIRTAKEKGLVSKSDGALHVASSSAP